MSSNYRVVEIFSSLQGEGFNLGMPCVFIRLGKCNLACSWCDTEYNRFILMTLAEIIAAVQKYTPKNVILTGGEPTIQPRLAELIAALKALNYYVAVETNGLKKIPPGVDYIAVSPKRAYQFIYAKMPPFKADEVRIVVDAEVVDFCCFIERLITAENYYLSPREENSRMNILTTVKQLGTLNSREGAKPWRLSLQAHKLLGIS